MRQPAPAPRLTSQLPAPTVKLSKPEPRALLALTRLQLSSKQREAIAAIARRWEADKAVALEAMAATQPKQGRLDQIQTGLAGYSELSRRYDAARDHAWRDALAKLTPAQLKEALR